MVFSIADTMLVIAQLLQPANDVLNAAAPGLGLPQLQRELFGSAVMGYGDLFVAGVFGAIVAAERGRQSAAARLTLLLAIPSTCSSWWSTCCPPPCPWRWRWCSASSVSGAQPGPDQVHHGVDERGAFGLRVLRPPFGQGVDPLLHELAVELEAALAVRLPGQ